MPTKDRLADLKASQDDPEEWEIAELQLNIEPKEGFMDEFFAEVEELRGMVEQMEAETEQLKKVQNDILVAPTTDEKMQQELSDLMASVKKTSNQVRYKLKAIEVSIEHSKEHSDSPADARIRRTQHAALLRKFVQLMTDYNLRQTEYRDLCKEKIQRQLEIAGKQVADAELERMLEEGGEGVFHEEIVMDPQVAKATLADIEARHIDIIAVENAIVELHDLFIDMAVMVESQGEMIDRIETQVEDSVEFVDRANADMKKALVLQRAAMRKKLMIIFVSFIGGSLVLFVVAKKLGLA